MPELDVCAPCIISVNDIFYIFVEKMRINDGTQNFKNALQMMFACYYVFNMQYMKETTSTLEFLQRYFAGIHPETGGKGKAVAKNKVLGLYNKLRDFKI